MGGRRLDGERRARWREDEGNRERNEMTGGDRDRETGRRIDGEVRAKRWDTEETGRDIEKKEFLGGGRGKESWRCGWSTVPPLPLA